MTEEENERMINDGILMELEEAIKDSKECMMNMQSGSNEREKEARNYKLLLEARDHMKQTIAEEEDRRERRRIEEEKNDNNVEIERIKATRGVKEWLYDNSGTVLKGAISLAGSLILLGVILRFEETGSIRSKGGRDFKWINPFTLKF